MDANHLQRVSTEDCFATTFPSELGWMGAIGRGKSLLRLTFGHASPQAAMAALGPDAAALGEPARPPAWIALLQAFARGEVRDLSPIEIELPPLAEFTRRVIARCRAIPFGKTSSYAKLAKLAGSPGAARAVGNIMAQNRLPLVVPCHRVLGSNGLGGYSAPGGLATKRKLLEAESFDQVAEASGKSRRKSRRKAALAV